MTDLPDLLDTDRIRCRCEIQSKKRALQTLAELLGGHIDDDELTDMDILDALISRERLGSTGIGHGVALPHSRLPGLEAPLAALISLNSGVDFEAIDDEPVDLVLGLLVPQECNDEHLKILAHLARRFSDDELRDALRQFDSPSELFEHLQTLPAAD